jgi:ATP-dependent exoDNAse (exonuclease V) beta subunit
VGPVLLRAVERRGRQSVRSLVESTWTRLGGPACINNDSELADAATYFDLIEALEAENLPIDRDTLALRLQDLSAEPDAGADGKLQVLTIYAAKGLQFDTVILPGLNRPPSGDRSKLLHWFELAGENRIVMSPMRNSAEKKQQKKSGDLIQFISGIEKQRQWLENGRLLYVAATRSIRRLHMFGAIKPGAKGDIKANANSLLGVLWPAIQAEQTPLVAAAAEQLQTAVNGENEEPSTGEAGLPQIYRRLAADWQLPAPPPAVTSGEAPLAEALNYIEFSWAGEDARHTGNLVHRILQMIGEQGLAAWEAGAGMPACESWCYLQLAREGVGQDKAAVIFKRVSRAIKNCLASKHGRWILDGHEDARCEYAIMAVLDQKAGPRSMVLDRTFVADGIRWIIDYKTSSHAGGDLEGFLDSEKQRYGKQLGVYRTALELTESRPIKTALYFPLLDRLVEVT